MGEFGIGQPVRRFEDNRLLSGNGRFQSDNDLARPGIRVCVALATRPCSDPQA